MELIEKSVKPFMVFAGLFTSTAVIVVFDPQFAFDLFFGGDSLTGPQADVIVRNWGALITGIGLLLLVGAFREEYRSLIFLIASSTKLFFIVTVINYGYLSDAIMGVMVDGLIILYSLVFLIDSRNNSTISSSET